MKYYLLHGVDSSRKLFMEHQFARFGIPSKDVTWITQPNKFDIFPKAICSNPNLTLGQISCTYKHYLALKDIVDNRHPVSVIMEDNIEFRSDVPRRLARYIRDAPSNWGCIFDSDILGFRFLESPVTPIRSVYRKSNEITAQCAGGSKGANFIMITYAAAAAMVSSFLPFDNVSDHYYNTLLRRHRIQSCWAEPPNVHKIERPSTCAPSIDERSETICTYVCSRGILKSCTYFDQKPGSSDQKIRFKIPDTTNATVYVSGCAVKQFIAEILPTRTTPFVLVSGDADTVVPDDIPEATILLEHPLLLGWAAQNCMGGHPKLHHIPIGLDYHTLMTVVDHTWGEHALPIQQETMLKEIVQDLSPFWERKIRCYGTFHFNWYASKDRTLAKETIRSDVIDYQEDRMLRETTWKTMTQYAFIPSPPGSGPDCHRTWEALILGCIPIVKRSGLDPLFEGLPVWIVNEWTDITEETMGETVDRFRNMTFDMSRLELKTWINTITSLTQ